MAMKSKISSYFCYSKYLGFVSYAPVQKKYINILKVRLINNFTFLVTVFSQKCKTKGNQTKQISKHSFFN